MAIGENIEIPDDSAGDLLELIWRDCVNIEKKGRNPNIDSLGRCVPTMSATVATPKGKESKLNQSKLKPTNDLFDVFWNMYPNKKGKGDARKRWERLNPGEDLCRKIGKALEQQMQSSQWKKDRGQFIPHPATWLNQERWLDEEVQRVYEEIDF